MLQAAMEPLDTRQLLSSVLAFPGAVGFGAYATGGRGGTVYVVTNLNDSGPGSFRNAVSNSSSICVFAVGGNIMLQSRVTVASNVTIEGQTAPGQAICVQGQMVTFSGNDITRCIRFRDGAADSDNSSSSVFLGSANNMTWYQDLFANAINRSPRASANTQFINCVDYDYGIGFTTADTPGAVDDVVNSNFIYGPNVSSGRFFTDASAWLLEEANLASQSFYGGSTNNLAGGPVSSNQRTENSMRKKNRYLQLSCISSAETLNA
jgi:hypothetical protein